MRKTCIALWVLLCPMTPARAQISVEIAIPSVQIGIDVSAYPELVVVPGYPVYYAPRAEWNLFFYDGAYWVYQGDNWYASSWYDGPWQLVRPGDVPLFVLRVPVRYYRRPPAYFRGWSSEGPPRWGEHWGRDWEQHRAGWDRWDRRSAPPAAPLPVYQRAYSGDRYPRAVEQQHSIRATNYRYQPREAVTQQAYRQRGSPTAEPQRPAPVQQAQPSKQTRPARRMQQVQPARAAPETQHPQSASQGERQERRAVPQDQGRQERAAPQDRGPQKRAAPQDKGPQKRAAPQDEGRQERAAPQDRQERAAPRERGGDEKDQHGKGPH